MKILNKYIFRQVFTMTTAVLAILLALQLFLTFVDQQGDVGKGNYAQLNALFYSGLRLPSFLVVIFPVATLLGALLGMGGLADHGELTAMRAAGISISRIIMSIIRAGIVLLLLVVAIGEFIAPMAEQYAEKYRSEKIHKQVVMQTSNGFWLKDATTFVSIETVLPGNILNNISIYELNNNNELRVYEQARQATYVDNEWQLSNINRVEINHSALEISSVKHRVWDSTISPSLLSAVSLKPGSLSLRELLHYKSFLDSSGQTSRPMEVALWSKIAVPLVTVVMLLLSVPLLFGSMRTTSVGQRIFIGAIIGVGFFLLNRTFSFIAIAFELNVPLVVLFPVLALGIAGLVSIYRIH